MPHILRYMLETDAINEKEVLKIAENVVLTENPDFILPIEVQSKYISVLMDALGKSGENITALSIYDLFQSRIRGNSRSFLEYELSRKHFSEEKQKEYLRWKSKESILVTGDLDPTWPVFYSYDMVGKEKILFDYAYRWNIPS